MEQPAQILRIMLWRIVSFLDHIHVMLRALHDIRNGHVARLHRPLLVDDVLLHVLDVLECLELLIIAQRVLFLKTRIR